MASQSVKTLKAALISQIDTEVSGFNLVTDTLRMADDYGSGSYPVCIIRIGGFTHGKFITRTESIDVQIEISIIGKESTTSDEIEDLYEAVVDAINTDLTLNSTCIMAMTHEADPAVVWPRDEKFILNGGIIVSYWRDIEPPADVYILLEDSDYLLQETGDLVIAE